MTREPWDLRILSWNLWELRGDLAALLEAVRDLQPDVLLVQEAPRFVLPTARLGWFARRIDIANHWRQRHPHRRIERPSRMDRARFIAAFGQILGDAPWLTERAFAFERGPAHDCAAGMANLLARAFRRASRDEQLAVLRALPEIAPDEEFDTACARIEAIATARLNSMLLMVILIWLQTGFAMVLLSSAIKGVPEDTIEAARIDGASELQIFWKVVIPQIKGTIVTVFITVLILVMKVFDIIYVLTNGRDNTDVIANMFFNQLFARNQAGLASTLVVVLLIAVIPILIFQVKQFREQEAMR